MFSVFRKIAALKQNRQIVTETIAYFLGNFKELHSLKKNKNETKTNLFKLSRPLTTFFFDMPRLSLGIIVPFK